MKPAVYFSVSAIILCLQGCVKEHNFMHSSNKQKSIAIQPFGDFDTIQLNYISREIESFYGNNTIVLKPGTIPPGFLLADEVSLYSADSLLRLLSFSLNKDIVEVIGLTDQEIYTTKKNSRSGYKTVPDYTIRSVFGMSYQPGNCCIISDYKLRTADTTRYNRRLRTVVFHELGHNLGLSHCEINNCIMSEKNGSLPLLDSCCSNYCEECRNRLSHR